MECEFKFRQKFFCYFTVIILKVNITFYICIAYKTGPDQINVLCMPSVSSLSLSNYKH